MGRGFEIIAGTALVAGAGAFALSGLSKDGHDNVNVDVGFYQYGDCAELLASYDVQKPSTSTQLQETIRNIGRVCGFCVSDTELNFEGASYKICIDPETIHLRYEGYAQPQVGVEAYMATVPESPEGYLFSAMDTNPGICSGTIASLEKEMDEYFEKAFVDSVGNTLIPNVHIAPTSNHPCEDVAFPPQS